ncbi:MAG: hypothetical protein PHW04_12605 [Candidatus Wallbacteria bacterium]|nr:hypothetical protein [Candidatus Wallbacteria bacterium]
MRLYLLLILFSFLAPLFAEAEREAYDALKKKFDEYTTFLLSNPEHVYDSVNNVQNRVLIDQYRKSTDEYLKAFSERPEFKILKKISLPSNIVQLYWVNFDNEELMFLVCLDRVALARMVEKGLEIVWEEKLSGIINVSNLDLESDGRREVIALGAENYYIIRKSKSERIYFQALPNQFNLRGIYKIGDAYLGTYIKLPDRTDIGSGWQLATLSWIHPGFAVERVLTDLPGMELTVDPDGAITMLANLEKDRGMVYRYLYQSGALTTKEVFTIDQSEIPLGVFPAGSGGKYYFVEATGVSRIKVQLRQGTKSSGKVGFFFLKQAWMKTIKDVSPDPVLVCLDFANQMYYLTEEKNTLPLYAQ